ncbi:hypothetical protein [Nocardia carnea]|uniref:hypothetical protein n=1 Tax=Nocardia carnea TaxID=37328 RepID=UPI0024550019|nr:hypothetical protein [Nocardia carnea]
MTSPLQVDIDVLTKFVTGLRNSQQILEDALKAMADVGAASIGTQTLDDADRGNGTVPRQHRDRRGGAFDS